MNPLLKWLLCGLCVFALTSPCFAADLKKPMQAGDVVVVPLQGEISEAQFLFLRRAMKEAEAQKAAAFVIDMDTYGGSLSAAVKILDLLLKSKLPTVTYVNTNAGSAGALIALGTKSIYMAPVSAIGAAAPVSSGGQEIGETMSSKIISYYSGYFRSAAEKNGYNPDVAEAFINKDKEAKIGDKVISAEGNLLTLSAQEAAEKVNGKPLLAAGIADSVEAVAKQAGFGTAPLVEFEPSGFERLALWVTILAPLFMAAGGLLAYLEFKSPGFGVAGVLSAICFLLFFGGHYLAGLTGFEVVAVFFLGVVLVIVELMFFPGVLLLSAVGLALMMGSLFFAMVDYWPSRAFEFDPTILVRPMIQSAIALVLLGIGVSLMARFLPSLPFFQRFMLLSTESSGAALPVPIAGNERVLPSVGDLGEAVSILRPSGRVQFRSGVVDVITDGEYLPAGTSVRVQRVEGSQVYVTNV